MNPRHCLLAALVVLAGSSDLSRAADPELAGELSGFEFCTQEICGQAAFAGRFTGTVDGRFAFGYWSAVAAHGPDPANGIIGPLPQGDGEQTQLVGQWTLNTWVLRGFRLRRVSFGGVMTGTLRNRGDNDRPVDNFDVAAVLTDGAAEFAVTGLLRHDRFPPNLDLTIGPAF